MKKILSLVLALMLVLGMVAAFAADPFDTPLTVTNLEAGDVAHFYQIIKWVGSATGNVYGWYPTDEFVSVLTPAVLKDVLGTFDDPATPNVDETVAGTGITPDLAGKLAKIAAGAGTAVAEVSGTATFNNTEAGMWMALVTPANVDTTYNPVFVASDYKTTEPGTVNIATDKLGTGANAVAKKSTTTLKKTAHVTEENYQDGKWTSTKIGETVNFEVETFIPAYGEVYQAPFFKISDKLTDLTLVKSSLTITEPAGAESHATITKEDDGYTILFDSAWLKTITTPTKVIVKYDAIVSTSAPVHVNSEKNEVWTEFSHDPTDENDHHFKKDDTIHYTFTLDAAGLGCTSTQQGRKTSELVKKGVDAAGNPWYDGKTTSEIDPREYVEGPLEGATFKLYTDSACNNEYIQLNEDGTVKGPFNLVSGPDGRFEIKGLDAGTYYLREEEAPSGYIKDTTIHKIEITMATKSVDVTEWTKDGKTWISDEAYQALTDKTGYKSYTYDVDVLDWYEVKVDGKKTAHYDFYNKGTDAEIEWTTTPPVEVPSPLINTQGIELPSTGGMGTTILYIGGSALVLLAVIFLVTKRRMKVED